MHPSPIPPPSDLSPSTARPRRLDPSAQTLLLALLALVMLGVVVSAGVAASQGDLSVGGLASNLLSEFIGAAVTLIGLELIVARRRQHEQTSQQAAQAKRDLIAQLRHNPDAADLINQTLNTLYIKGWAADGDITEVMFRNVALQLPATTSLQRCHFTGCNFTTASVSMVNLSRSLFYDCTFAEGTVGNAVLDAANFINADFRAAQVEGASFLGAHFMATTFEQASVTELCTFRAARFQDVQWVGAQAAYVDFSLARFDACTLRAAVFDHCDFKHVVFTSVVMSEADLTGSSLMRATFEDCTLTGVVLPDGSVWEPSTDMGRFTDSSHPQFWEPEWAKEPKPHSPMR